MLVKTLLRMKPTAQEPYNKLTLKLNDKNLQEEFKALAVDDVTQNLRFTALIWLT